MGHVIEPAASGRARCRACGGRIDKGELRFGERAPNPFGEGDATYWFHVVCAACRRPEAFLSVDHAGVDAATRSLAEAGRDHHRLPRIRRAEQAPTGRAKCRQCREPIAAGTWRIALEIWEEGRFNPVGFIHAGCAEAYFGTLDLLPRIVRFSEGLSADDVEAIKVALHSG